MSLAKDDRLGRLVDFYGAAYRTVSDERVREAVVRRSSLLIFGAGQNGALVLSLMRAAGLAPVGFVDDTPAKVGQTRDGVPIMTLESAAKLPNPIAVVSIFRPQADYLTIAERLRRNNIESVPLFAFLWAYGQSQLPFYFLSGPEQIVEAIGPLQWLSKQLLDTVSRDVLCGHVEFRLGLRFEALPAWSPTREKPPLEWPAFHVVDAGAFDGDTLLPLLEGQYARVRQAIALEPDPTTFERLTANVLAAGADVSNRTTLIRAAVDSHVGQRAFANVGNQGSSFADTGITVDTVSIDSVVDATLDPDGPIYIKYDVEGAEAAALMGSRDTIRTRRPFLSVAAYHTPSDLWELARIISEIDDGYRFMLRSHGADGADLNLYAVPPV